MTVCVNQCFMRGLREHKEVFRVSKTLITATVYIVSLKCVYLGPPKRTLNLERSFVVFIMCVLNINNTWFNIIALYKRYLTFFSLDIYILDLAS